MKLLKNLFLATLLAAGAAGLLSTQALAAGSQIRIGYVQSWPSSSLTTKLAAQVLRKDLHKNVKLLALSAGPMYQGIASGDLDAMLTAWLPKTHAQYYNKLWSKMINLGPNLLGTRLGLAVPKYVKVNSIAGLKGKEGEFNHRVVGVGSGAGININTKKAIKQYGLNMHLVPSSTAAMAASLKRAIREKKPIVVTAWAPLWIWSRFDLKFLKDPKDVYGRAGYVSTLVNPSLPKKDPTVYRFLDRFHVSLQDIDGMEAETQKGMSEQKAIDKWLSNHQKEVKSWTYGL